MLTKDVEFRLHLARLAVSEQTDSNYSYSDAKSPSSHYYYSYKHILVGSFLAETGPESSSGARDSDLVDSVTKRQTNTCAPFN